MRLPPYCSLSSQIQRTEGWLLGPMAFKGMPLYFPPILWVGTQKINFSKTTAEGAVNPQCLRAFSHHMERLNRFLGTTVSAASPSWQVGSRLGQTEFILSSGPRAPFLGAEHFRGMETGRERPSTTQNGDSHYAGFLFTLHFAPHIRCTFTHST